MLVPQTEVIINADGAELGQVNFYNPRLSKNTR